MDPLTYQEFIDIVGDNKFVKCINTNLIQNDFQYKEGINVDHNSIEPYYPNYADPGPGLYFTTIGHVHEFIGCGPNIAEIELCKDAKFYIDTRCKYSFKTNKLILKKVTPQTEEILMLAIDYSQELFIWVENQTDNVCKKAVSKNGLNLQYVKNKTNEICKIALQQNGCALRYIYDQTEEICKFAVQNCGLALQHVIKQTDEICKLAVQNDGRVLVYVKNKTDEICRLAEQQIKYRDRYKHRETL